MTRPPGVCTKCGFAFPKPDIYRRYRIIVIVLMTLIIMAALYGIGQLY